MQRHDGPHPCHILGVARSEMSDEDFRETIRSALIDHGLGNEDVSRWCYENVYYQSLGPTSDQYDELRERVDAIEGSNQLPGNRVFYLALPPRTFPGTIRSIGAVGLNDTPGWTRLVIEKPFGHDLASALALNDLVHGHFDESQIFRIDHYLGKETVQNLLVFRFANALFESVWHRGEIEQVEIAVHEQLGVGTRAGYYDDSGALRDMVQNHLTQLVSLVAMDAPTRFDAAAIRREKVKVLESIAPIDPGSVVFGQYDAGRVDGRSTPSYRDEEGVSAESSTETFVQLRLEVANWRWKGVPFILRTGKRLHEQRTKIVIRFRPAPVSVFQPFSSKSDVKPNVLIIRLQPDEGFDLSFEVKEPRPPLRLGTQTLRYRYRDGAGDDLPDAYETLLLDILQGDQTLFVHSDEVINSWKLYTPLLERDIPVHPYEAGSVGPDVMK